MTRDLGDDRSRFEREVLAHLDAAISLARWITRSPDDAADVVQESCLRAWRHFAGKRDGDAKPWLLAIVRNTARTWLIGNRRWTLPGDDAMEAMLAGLPDASPPEDPESLLRRVEARATLASLIERLPRDWREVLVLREIEELSYREIADVTGAPIGTVMSRLARARARLQQSYFRIDQREDADGMP